MNQVVVAIDDSGSMVEEGNMSGQLALEALVVMTKAMAQLEVGEFAVVKFGEETTLLHPFDQPFTDEAGAAFISQVRERRERLQQP